MSVGARLAEARESAGLSIEDVSRTTRVRSTLLRAIEADDFGLCGGAVYARGHIRSMAQAVGLDPEPLIAEYDEQYGSPIPSNPTPAFDPEVAERTTARRPNWSAAMASVLALVSLVAAFQLITADHKPRPTSVQDELNGSLDPTPSASAVQPPAPKPTDAVAFVNPNIVTLRITITGPKSWVSVTNSAGKVLFRDVLRRGQSMDFTDPAKLSLIIGDSGSVSLVVNGRELGSPGGRGEVTRPEFTPGDPAGAGG